MDNMLEQLFAAPPQKTLPEEVADLCEVAEKTLKDFRIARHSDTSYGTTVTLYATCCRCGDGLGFPGGTLREALSDMLISVNTDCPKHGKIPVVNGGFITERPAAMPMQSSRLAKKCP